VLDRNVLVMGCGAVYSHAGSFGVGYKRHGGDECVVRWVRPTGILGGNDVLLAGVGICWTNI
jgi:hypothetical protein